MHGFVRPVAPDREIWDRAVNAQAGAASFNKRSNRQSHRLGLARGTRPTFDSPR